MTGQRDVTRYASPSLRFAGFDRAEWSVTAAPWNEPVGLVERCNAGWTATTHNGRYAGLYPHKQAAAEVLVKQAGYELEMG